MIKNDLQDKPLLRRDFLRLAGSGALALSVAPLLDGCGSSGHTTTSLPSATPTPLPLPSSGPSSTPSPSPTPSATPTPIVAAPTRYQVRFLYQVGDRSAPVAAHRQAVPGQTRWAGRAAPTRQSSSVSGATGWNGSINDRGEVAGYIGGNVLTDDVKELALTRPGQAPLLLGVSGADLYEFISTTRVNNHSQVMAVVGRVSTGSTTQETFFWESGTLTPVFGPAAVDGDTERIGMGFNNSGVIVFNDYKTNTFGLWKNGEVVFTGPYGYLANDINDAGQVLCRGYGSASTLFDPASGASTDLPPASSIPYVQRLNNTGQAFGSGGLSGGFGNPVWYHDNLTVAAPLLDPSGKVSASSYAEMIALDINDAGQMVGDTRGRALLWRSGSQTPVYLDTLIPADSGWTLTWAAGINNAGQIIGEGAFQPVSDLSRTAAYLLTPEA